MFKIYKILDYSNGFLDTLVSTSKLALYNQAPVKVTVSYPGKQDKVYTISEAYAISMGADPIKLEVNMDSQISMYTLIGDDVKQAINLSPANPANSTLLELE